ncbi:hypothetical protein [Streptomyces sp. NBC_00299]|uniref:hypothetical protein n=1 Tax=Streptomyces sp. NBC_00299 TaxID=2975705 RepID=UPI002E28F03B|nr:hypothetical protein [Streptomyces sp. NBC_00299]
MFQADFEDVTGALLPDRPRAEAAFAKAIVERDAKGWHYSLTWMETGDALVEMAGAERALRGRPDRSQQSAQVQAARARSAHAIRSSVATTAAVSAAAAPPSLLAHDRVRRSR